MSLEEQQEAWEHQNVTLTNSPVSLLQPSISWQRWVLQSQLQTSNSKPHVLNFMLCFQMFTLYVKRMVCFRFGKDLKMWNRSIPFFKFQENLLFVYTFTLLDVSAVQSVSSLGEVPWEILKKKNRKLLWYANHQDKSSVFSFICVWQRFMEGLNGSIIARDISGTSEVGILLCASYHSFVKVVWFGS